MMYVHTKIKMLNGSTVIAPIERVDLPCISYGCIIQWKFNEPYEVEIYPNVFVEKQDYLNARVIEVEVENDCCKTTYVTAVQIASREKI